MSVSTAPKKNESYKDFVRRAHKELMKSIPNPHERNRVVWDAWEKSHGNAISQQAQEYFPADQYRFVPKSVCYFTEHTAPPPGRDLPPKKYDFDELARIVERANSQMDGDYYPAISSHHNQLRPDAVKHPDREPFIVGYMGEHRLGMIGRSNPKWAVFVDEFHDQKYSSLFDHRRRRSVEALIPRDGSAPFFDPCALLGSEPPRLQLPVAQYSAPEEMFDRYHYSAVGDVEHYEFSEASANNAFVPGFGAERNSTSKGTDLTMTYGQESQNPPVAGTSSLTQEDVMKVVQALMATPQMKFVSELMESQGQAVNQPLANSSPQTAQPGTPLRQPQLAPHHSSGQNVPPGAGGNRDSLQLYSLENEEMDQQQYSAIQDELEISRQNYSALSEEHNELKQAHRATMQEMSETKKQLNVLFQEKRDSDRTLAIRELYSQFPHFIQEDEELQRCLYSRGSQMNDEAFAAHLSDLKKYASRSPVATQMVPQGQLNTVRQPVDTALDAKVSELVVERYSAECDRGLYRSYAEIEREVRKELVG